MEEPTNIQMLNWARELKNRYVFETQATTDFMCLCDEMADFIDEFIRLNQ